MISKRVAGALGKIAKEIEAHGVLRRYALEEVIKEDWMFIDRLYFNKYIDLSGDMGQTVKLTKMATAKLSEYQAHEEYKKSKRRLL